MSKREMWQSNIPYTDPMSLGLLSSDTFTMQPNYAQAVDPTIEQLEWAGEDVLFGGLAGMWGNSLALPQQQPTQPLSQLQPCENHFELHNEQRPYSLEVGPSSPGERQLSPEVESRDTRGLDELKIRVASLEETVSGLQVMVQTMNEALCKNRRE